MEDFNFLIKNEISSECISWLNKYAPKDFSDCPLKSDEKN